MITTNYYNLKKPELIDNIPDTIAIDLPYNFDVIDSVMNGRLNYETTTVVSRQIRMATTRHGDIVRFKLDSAIVLGTVISISLDNGATSLPIKDIDGADLLELDKGFYEVVYATSFFTLRPSGAKKLTGDNVATASSVSGTTLKLTPPKGYYDGASGLVTITDADFIAGNILKDINLLGKVGTAEKLNMVEGSVTATSGPGGGGSCNVTLGFRAKMFVWWYDATNNTAFNEGGFGFDKDGNTSFNAPTYYDSTYSRTYETTGFRGINNTFYVRTEDYANPTFSSTGFVFFTSTNGRTYRYIAIY